MRSESKESSFVFSEYFNSNFLEELYGSDLEAAEEVFNSARNQIVAELALAENQFRKRELEGVRKIYHKIKPLFGYVGLGEVQDYVQRFEDNCVKAASLEELQPAYDNINTIIGEALIRIEQESERLKDYLNQRA